MGLEVFVLFGLFFQEVQVALLSMPLSSSLLMNRLLFGDRLQRICLVKSEGFF